MFPLLTSPLNPNPRGSKIPIRASTPASSRGTLAKPSTIKRSVVLAGHATSVSLEPEFWEAVQDIACADGVSVASLIARIDADLGRRQNLSSAIRVFILKRLQEAAR